MSIFPLGHLEVNATVLNWIFSCVSFLHEDEYLPIVRGWGEEEKSFNELLLTHLGLGLVMEMSRLLRHSPSPPTYSPPKTWQQVRGCQWPRTSLQETSEGAGEPDTEASVLTQETFLEKPTPINQQMTFLFS